MAIGTGLALIGGSIASSAIGAIGASKAAKAQQKGADAATALQKEMYGETVKRMSPFYEAGKTANQAYNYMLGLGDAPEGFGGYSVSPMAQYLIDEGMSGIEGMRAKAGGLFSGATLKALEDDRRRVIGADVREYMDRVGGVAAGGQNAAANMGNAGANYANNAGNAMMTAANAKAGGYLGMANAIQGGIGDMAGIYGYLQGPMGAFATPANNSNWLFGGNSWG